MNMTRACVAALLAFGLSGGNGVVLAADPVTTDSALAAPVSAPLSSALGADDEADPSLPALDQAVVKEVILSHMNAVKHCYNQELKKDAALAGKVVVKFTVGAKGPVTSATVKQTTLNNKEVEDCMVKEVKTWIFPEPRRGEIVEISFPFLFKPTT